MNRTTVISVAAAILLLATFSEAQVSSARVTFSEAVNLDSSRTVTISFPGLENPNVQLFEAIVPATSKAACFASTDFSNARPIGVDRASVVYDSETGVYELIWTTAKENRDSCRILLGDSDVDGADFVIWRKSFGSTLLADADTAKDDESATVNTKGALISSRVHYSVSFQNAFR